MSLNLIGATVIGICNEEEDTDNSSYVEHLILEKDGKKYMVERSGDGYRLNVFEVLIAGE